MGRGLLGLSQHTSITADGLRGAYKTCGNNRKMNARTPCCTPGIHIIGLPADSSKDPGLTLSGKKFSTQACLRLHTTCTPSNPPTVYDSSVHRTPLGRLSKVDCLTTKRVRIPNFTSSKSSPRHPSNADLFGHRHCSDCGDINHGISAQGWAIHRVEHGTYPPRAV